MQKSSYILLGLFVLILSACAGQEKSGDPVVKVLPASEYEERLKEQKQPQLLDVRTPDEFADGHIEGARNINVLDQGSFESALESLDKDRPVLVYCQVGGRSRQATRILREKGFREVFDLEGGYKAWLEGGRQ